MSVAKDSSRSRESSRPHSVLKQSTLEYLWSWVEEPSHHDAEASIVIDPEALSKEERSSRKLHTYIEPPAIPLTGRLFEHFIVVGLPPDTTSSKAKPEILWSYPDDTAISMPGLPDFCFPNGIRYRTLKRTKSCSQILQVICTRSALKQFVFLLTTMEKEHLYGMCVIRNEVLETLPTFASGQSPNDAPPPSLDDMKSVTSRCYCLISRFPFFSLHFQVLGDIINLEYGVTAARLAQLDLGADAQSLLDSERPITPSRRDSVCRAANTASSPALPTAITLKDKTKSAATLFSSPMLRRSASMRPCLNDDEDNGESPKEPENQNDQNEEEEEEEESYFPGVKLFTKRRTPRRLESPTPSLEIPRRNHGSTGSSGSISSEFNEDALEDEWETTESKKAVTRLFDDGSFDPPSIADDTNDQGDADEDMKSLEDVDIVEKEDGAVVDDTLKKKDGGGEEGDQDGGGEEGDQDGGGEEGDQDGGGEEGDQDGGGEEGGQDDDDGNVKEGDQKEGKIDPPNQVDGVNHFVQDELKDDEEMPIVSAPRRKKKRTRRVKGKQADNGPVHDVLKLLMKYYRLPVPKPNHYVTFSPPCGLDRVVFKRPFHQEEEELLGQLCIPLIFQRLSSKNLSAFLMAVLLEKKVVLFSSDARLLSAAGLSVIPLLRPFSYPAILIPILPKSLSEFLEAPVPYVLGVTNRPELANSSDRVFINLDTDKLETKVSLPNFPRTREFKKKWKAFAKSMRKAVKNADTQSCVAHERVNEAAKRGMVMMQAYLGGLFSHFRRYCLSDRTNSEEPITVFLKDSFCAGQSKGDVPFFKEFLETQIFLDYCDRRVRALDSSKELERRASTSSTMMSDVGKT